ncbi:hypothetical protein [Deinococcus radiopugnans]|uniref:hypothetical protein n=1 Tax=Deinococcus radiopugnans TaxID=57497 RepID=UPI0012E036EE|nr:hypothetical protein [Deinococcus radiopugnans]
MPHEPTQNPAAVSPLSRQQRLAQREAILLQQERGELSVTAARAALARLESPPALRE